MWRCWKLTSNYVTMSHIWIIYAHWLLWLRIIDLSQLLCCCGWCWLRCVWVDQSEETGYLGQGSLKRLELKQSVSDRGGIQCYNTGCHEKTDVFLNTKAWKPILMVTQNKNMNLKVSFTYPHVTKYIYLSATYSCYTSYFCFITYISQIIHLLFIPLY